MAIGLDLKQVVSFGELLIAITSDDLEEHLYVCNGCKEEIG
jgi:hypothetical protein